jgi:hypothetical protein
MSLCAHHPNFQRRTCRFLPGFLMICLISMTACQKKFWQQNTQDPTPHTANENPFVLFLESPKNAWKAILESLETQQPVIQQQAPFTIQVISQQGAPLPGTQVLVQFSAPSTFSGPPTEEVSTEEQATTSQQPTAAPSPTGKQLLTTDTQGKINLPSSSPDTIPSITFHQPGFVRATYLHFPRLQRLVVLRPLSRTEPSTVEGQATGFQTEKDGWVDFALVMPGLTKTELFNFQLSMVISPFFDRIQALGKTLKIPSNISLPDQTENYFLPVNLSKPIYRLSFSETGLQRLYALRGRFPFKKVVDELRQDKMFVDVLNLFSMQGAGQRDIELRANKNQLDIPAFQTNFQSQSALKAPSAKTDEVGLGIMGVLDQGLLFPTDVKTWTPGSSMTLRHPQQGRLQVLYSLKKRTDFEDRRNPRMSASLEPLELLQQSESILLPLITTPIQQQGPMTWVLPAQTVQMLPNSLLAHGTYAVISAVSSRKVGQDTAWQDFHEWEFFAPEWVTTIQLPESADWKLSPGPHRIEISYLAGRDAKRVDLGLALLENASHVTKTFLDFHQ